MAKSKKTKPFALKNMLSAEQSAWLRKAAVHTSIVAVLLSGALVGLKYLKQYIDRRVVFYPRAPKVILKDRPAWMSDYLAEQIVTAAQPLGAHSTFDHQL